MNEDRLIKTVNFLLTIGTLSLLNGLTYIVITEHGHYDKPTPKRRVEIFSEPEEKITPIYNEALNGYYELKNEYMKLEIEYQTIEYTYIGRYFVTAYSHEETGSLMTASGELCHYHDEWYEPTTAAIDRRYHRFGEYLAIDFGDYRKVYVTEDTGAFSGLWIDCYVPDLPSVHSWGTGYYDTYSVDFIDHTAKGNGRMERQAIMKEYIRRNAA